MSSVSIAHGGRGLSPKAQSVSKVPPVDWATQVPLHRRFSAVVALLRVAYHFLHSSSLKLFRNGTAGLTLCWSERDTLSGLSLSCGKIRVAGICLVLAYFSLPQGFFVTISSIALGEGRGTLVPSSDAKMRVFFGDTESESPLVWCLFGTGRFGV